MLNPAPQCSDISSSAESPLYCIEESVFVNYFSVVHYNVQRLWDKIHQIQLELHHFVVITLSEIWLSTSMGLKNYQQAFRKDRQTNICGAVD